MTLSIPPIVHSLLEALVPEPATAATRLRLLVNRTLEINRELNLTGDDEPEIFWTRQIEDSLRAARCLQDLQPAVSSPAERILDVGAGGGIPGLVWAILWPRSEITLLEARTKKTRFLQTVAAELGLDKIRVVPGRAESLARDPALRESFPLVTARALAALPALLELTLPFVRCGGFFSAIKAFPLEDELRQADAARRILGAPAPPRLCPYTRGDGKESVVVHFLKQTPTPERYPRAAGIPVRRPLR